MIQAVFRVYCKEQYISGHSKWHSIKHKKAITDNKRGQLFTKIIKEISIATRLGGGDPSGNSRLRLALAKAKEANMPTDNIERAIKKGTGELEGVDYEEVVYEGYGLEGVAFIVDVLTDNRNRTVAELRKIFSKHGGHLGESGSVSWMFQKQGVILVHASKEQEDTIMQLALEEGANDILTEGSDIIVYTDPERTEVTREALQKHNIEIKRAGIEQVAQSSISVEKRYAERNLDLIESLENHDDVQSVTSNLDFSTLDL